ncbi:hypothetical protein LTR53_018353, partial [Teratosphaeriaceae sp. CCFEE 6253]
MAYGRVGRRRRELLAPLMPVAAPADEAGNDNSNPTPTSAAISNPTTPTQPRAPTAAQVNRGLTLPYAPEFTPQLRALLTSQTRHPPPHLTRPPLRRLAPRLEELNAWMRPMPLSRVKNQTQEWYARTLERTHAPLPLAEWTRLRALALGEISEEMPRRRSAREVGLGGKGEGGGGGEVRPGALEMVVLYGKPHAKK